VHHLPFNSINYTRFKSPLRQRAWTFQEEYLSRRFLEFGEGQMSWKCIATDATESEPESCCARVEQGHWTVAVRILKDGIDPVKPQLKARNRRRGDGSSYDGSWYDEWYSNVQMYAVRQLSFETDRLAALAGFADVTSGFVLPGDEYLAGLWRKDLLFGLTWYVMPRPKPDLGNTTYIAPSWSWASVGCQYLENPWSTSVDMEEIPGVFVHEAWIKLKSKVSDASPYGQIASGKLVLVAPLEPFSLLPAKDDPPHPGIGYLMHPIRWIASGNAIAKDLQGAIFYSDFLDAFKTHQHQHLWLLPLHRTDWGMSGLALAPINVARYIFRRVGMVMCPNRPSRELFNHAKFSKVTIV
jgi:hypothetical protein